jgi:chromosome segregation ATPase
MPYTLGQAARATGKSKPTVQRSIKIGRISAAKDALGNWQIEPAELHRVYPLLNSPERQEAGQTQHDVAPSNTPLLDAEIRRLTERLAEKERQISDLREERDRWREESDSWRRQANSLLTDQRRSGSNSEDQARVVKRRSRWKFWR